MPLKIIEVKHGFMLIVLLNLCIINKPTKS